MKYAMRIEIKVMQSLNEKFMSDEETDPEDGTIKFQEITFMAVWKTQFFNKKLDKRHLKKK